MPEIVGDQLRTAFRRKAEQLGATVREEVEIIRSLWVSRDPPRG
ncbi:hypothetical protein ABIF90_007293 [Bradyrhizobium japonicum]